MHGDVPNGSYVVSFPTGRFTLRDEPAYLVIAGEGFFSTEQVIAHFHDVRRVLLARHRSNSPVRSLVDLRAASVQSQEVARRIGEMTAEVYRDADRVALIVSSSLQKVQMRRILPEGKFGIFVREAAAIEHLTRLSPVRCTE